MQTKSKTYKHIFILLMILFLLFVIIFILIKHIPLIHITVMC